MKTIKVVELLKEYDSNKRALILRQEELIAVLKSGDVKTSVIKHACLAFLDAEREFDFLEKVLYRLGVKQ